MLMSSAVMASRQGVISLGTALLATCISTVAGQQSLPYVPTTILPLSDSWVCENHTNHGLYVFLPTDTSVDLLFVNTSKTLQASTLKPQVLTSGLPFTSSQSRTSAFTPSVADDGTLTVFAGDCSSPGNEAIWIFGEMSSTSGAPGWVKHAAPQGISTGNTPGAPYLMGGSISFSSTISPSISSPVTYVYGGMCPWTNSTTATWQFAATYSNQMLKVSTVSSRGGALYKTESLPSSISEPPRAEAGFTLTPLWPALSNRSGTVSQEISHVLLGGHTQNAFINMSTAAVWNLPEETWNIVYISPPSTGYGDGNTELAVKDLAGHVDSRSGHTAVLNQDGTAIAIYGGWVGDLSQAAMPQLVVLEMGSSLADWRWSIPEKQPTGPGIYGHGAVLLPGNVMMVYGGYATTSADTTGTAKRAAGQQPMFLNLTSLTWSDEYTNPSPPSSSSTTGPSIPGSTTSSSGPTSSSLAAHTNASGPSKLGLGLGLGLGIPFLLALIALAIWFRRRQRRKRLRRDEVVRGLAQDAGRFLSTTDDDGEMTEADVFGSNWFPAGWSGGNSTAGQDWYTGGADPYSRGRRSLGYETMRGANKNGAYTGPVLPPGVAAAGGLNRSRSAARGLHVPTPGMGASGYEFVGSPPAGAGGIHPTIYEDEDEDGELVTAVQRRSTSVSPEHPSEGDAASDPFVTPATTPRGLGPGNGTGAPYFPLPRSSATPSPKHQYHYSGSNSRAYQAQDAEVQEWVSDVDATDAMLSARIGPHGGTTTTTTSTPTPAASPTPPKAARPTRSRRNSLSFPPEGGQGGGSDEARTGSNLSESARSTFSFKMGESSRAPPAGSGGAEGSAGGIKRNGSSSGSSANTYNTARTHGGNGNSFAGLREEGPSLLLGSAARGYSPEHNDDNNESPPGSPSKHRPRRSWLGSLRRVFSGSVTESSQSSRGESPTHDVMGTGAGGSGSDYEPRLVGMGPGGRLLRRKQGREAWTAAQPGQEDEEDEWDVERAVEQRLVQIMFTVPKERLRVVNAEIEREEEAEIVDLEQERLYEEEEEEDLGDGGFGSGARYRRGEGAGHSEDAEKAALRREKEERARYTPEPLRLSRRDDDYTDAEKLALRREESRQTESTVQETLLNVHGQERRPSTPMTLRSTNSTTFHTAEAVTLERPPRAPQQVLHTIESVESMERPRTKVLQMVESIESMSRGDSPVGSPAREK